MHFIPIIRLSSIPTSYRPITSLHTLLAVKRGWIKPIQPNKSLIHGPKKKVVVPLLATLSFYDSDVGVTKF